MEGSAGAPPQRVCPKCARISWATGPQCPYCRARFTRPTGVRPWMLIATGAVVLLGVLVMFIIAGNRFDDRVNDVDKQVESALNQLRTDVRKELDSRLPPAGAGGAVTPTPTPFATPTPAPTTEGEPTETPTPDEGDGIDQTPTPVPSPIQP
jgi:hypothetical protein